MAECIAAWTAAAGTYPPYFNVSRDGDDVVIIVREAPTVHENAGYVCGFAGDHGRLGRCTPGDERCNNYCNMAPEKGPMQDRPAPCRQVHEGKCVQIRMPFAEWQALALIAGATNDPA